MEDLKQTMEEVDQPNTAAVFSAVVSYENPQSLVSPEGFRDIILAALENGIKGTHLTSYQPYSLSYISKDVDTSSENMLLSSLSALEALFQYVEETNIDTLKVITKVDSENSILKNPLETSSQNQKYSELKKIITLWYQDAAKQLSSSNITKLLVKYLVSGNKITSFLARKALLSGMLTQHIEASQVLSLLKKECNVGCHLCVPVIEILRDMMSQRRFIDRQIHCKTFSLLKEMNLDNFVETQFMENQMNYFDTCGLLEYLSLLRKVIKYGLHKCENSTLQDIFFITETVSKILLPLVDYFFTTAKGDNVYLICLESVKAINTLLDVRFLMAKSTLQECIFHISASLQTKVLLYIQMAHKSNLLSGFNFVGTIFSLKDKSNISISALTRQLILLALKTICFALKGDCSFRVIMGDLECTWNEVSCIINCTNGQLTKDWLPIVFADQDDQWIIALFCLLIIHRELNKWQSNNQECSMMDAEMTTSKECSLKNLQHTICPHRLFLQLAGFIDYDHLVLVDFLTSPESPFLSYFTQYLHVLGEDWQGFVLACLKEDTDFKTRQSNSENCNPGKHPYGEQESYEDTESSMSLSKSCAAETLPQYFIRRKGVPHSNILPPFQAINEASTLCREPVHIAVSYSDVPPSEILKDPLQISKALSGDSVYPMTLSNDSLQTSTALSYDPLLNSTSMARTILNSTALSSDNFCNLSVLSSDGSHNSSAVPPLNEEEHRISVPRNNDVVLNLYCSHNGGSSLALVEYSDSDSDDCMEKTKTDIIAKKQNLKSSLSSDSDSDICLGDIIEMHENSVTLKRSGGSDALSVSDHESTSDNITDENLKLTNEVDNILGMLIRLRLHVERLDCSNLFPYNPKPLVLLLEACEELYEKPSEL